MATKAMATKPHLYYMSAWFCPFAHRATLALEHHSEHLTYEWIEALGWEKRKASDECVTTAHENWYHYKVGPGWDVLGASRVTSSAPAELAACSRRVLDARSPP
jgi:hypothetical protein